MIYFVEFCFWISGLAIPATYVFYPLSIAALAKVFAKDHETSKQCPPLTLIVSAYNEEQVIEEKIRNALELDYPPENLEIIVISDGSTDGTDDIVRRFADRRVRLCRQDPQAGKSLGLTRFVPEAKGEIIVFSDANSMYDTMALRNLVRHFHDPKIGYAVGHQRYDSDQSSAVSVSERSYWDFEVSLKQWESAFGSVVGGDGAIYAIRAELFRPLARDDISDFVNPLQIVVQGYRGVFDREAFCLESVPSSYEAEFRRKVRIVNRALRGLVRTRQALNPFRVGAFAYQVFFHKAIRWFVPYFMIGLMVCTLALVWQRAQPIHVLALWGQLAFYGLALFRFVPGAGNWKPVYLAYYFCMANLAALFGTFSYFRGRRFVTWRPERA